MKEITTVSNLIITLNKKGIDTRHFEQLIKNEKAMLSVFGGSYGSKFKAQLRIIQRKMMKKL